MNCNLDRTPLTVEQLETLARTLVSEDAMTTSRAVNEKAAMWLSWLDGVTRQLRWEMCLRGELVLDTSRPFVPKPERPWVIDPFFLNQRRTASIPVGIQ